MILEGLSGVVCQMGDILILAQVKKSITPGYMQFCKGLNRDKCEFNRKSVKFLGHLTDGQGIRADPDKKSALEISKFHDVCQNCEDSLA